MFISAKFVIVKCREKSNSERRYICVLGYYAASKIPLLRLYNSIDKFCFILRPMLNFFFLILATPTAYRSSWARDQTQATAVAMPNP